MKLSIKLFIGIALLVALVYFTTYYSDDISVIEKPADIITQINSHEAPHLVYKDGKSQVISGVPENGQMTLSIKPLESPNEISVYKPGENPVTFKVPLKKAIKAAPVSYPQPEKIFAISDVEGNFNTVTGLLKKHQVINEQLHWNYGKGHLVIIGDVFDRGNHVTELLWLLYRLEDEAKAQGGMVHMLIGNHEMMVMQNDLRYVEPKYLKFDELLKAKTGLTTVDLFRQNTELGRWLRSKNIVEKIGDTLFTHGGMSPKMVERKLTLEQINKTMIAAIDTKKPERNELEKLLFGRNGPMWYRGYFMPIPKSPMIEDNELDAMLEFYGAKRIAVGHTIVEKPKLMFDGRVIAVDVKHPADHFDTDPPRVSYGVVIEGHKVEVVSFIK